ncbi:protoporphyrinogen oxidase [Aeoliella sp. ICT_H6.2]|uniref:Coproporphyrinogen III oxidase n=1 Tax=Aeoliella straminimaris TaxID=2954799 RepID=A0A9X2F684_9BACT|nr:protoporphyrinogen oxidase [Aeoliella straminimaris]MCO6043007.1 protoporphyrinogen oxidase [Aeoliella straminimaris]
MDTSRETVRSVAVIGGGISGLAAAWRLVELRPEWQVVVLEASDEPGGVIQTVQRDDFTLELGPDSLLRRLPWGVDLCRRLGIEQELIGTEPAAKGVYTVHRGRATRMPEGFAIMAPERTWPVVTTPILSPWGKLRLAAERLVPRRTASTDESLAAFACRRLGREAFERIVQPLAGGIFMGDPERLSLKSCFPQFAAMEAEHGSLIKATQAARKQREAKADGKPQSVFTAPAGGLGRIIEAAAEKLGERVRCGQRVVQLASRDDAWQLRVEDIQTGEQADETYDAVIVATPASATARLLESVDPRVSELLAGVEYSSCVIVQLGYQRKNIAHPLDAAGVVVPNVEGRALQACSFSSVKYAGRAPDGSVVLRAFFGGAMRPELPAMSDEKLIELAKSEVGTLLGASGEPLFTVVKRWQSSMPQYHVGHAERVDEIEQRTAAHHGLELAGAALHGVGIPHCIHTAEDAARRVVEQLERDATGCEKAGML